MLVGYEKDDKERLSLEAKFAGLLHEDSRFSDLVSYVGNKKVPLLRLYRYKEAFGFELVREFIRRFDLGRGDYIFDPFAGMGTTLFASAIEGIPSVGVERLPVATFVAQTLPHFLSLQPGQLITTMRELEGNLDRSAPAPVALDVPLMKLAYDEQTLFRLRQRKGAIDRLDSPLREVFLLLFFSILEPASYTSNDGQFLRLKKDKRPRDADDALWSKVFQAEDDVQRVRWLFPNLYDGVGWKVFLGDARELSSVPFERPPTAIVTSPPYPNRYDYSRSYCLELCFHFVSNFAELRSIRRGLLRSHIESMVSTAERPPHPAVAEAVAHLRQKELNNPRIPHMLTGYFIDMARAIQEWWRVMAPGGWVAMVVDNVRFEGELMPVDLILSDMAQRVGFTVSEIVVARYKGNSSQQMGKYGRVPVRESIVVWRKP